jgi:hypothetical protein
MTIPTRFGDRFSLRRFVWVFCFTVPIWIALGFLLHDWIDIFWCGLLPFIIGYALDRSDEKRRAEQTTNGLGTTGMSPVNQSSPEPKE